MKLRLVFPALVLVCASAVAGAQEPSAYVVGMLQGGGKPVTMKPSALTPDFHAVQIKTAGGGGGNGLMDMIMSPMMMMMGMMGSMGGESDGKDEPPFALFSALELSWTTGETQAFLGQTYLVTYKMDMDMAAMSKIGPKTGGDLSNADMRLQLVRADAIQTLTPRPDVTPAAYIQMLKVPKPVAKPQKPAKA